MKLYVRNWHRWQFHRKDRAQPPWIKLHRVILRNPEWADLTDSQKGQLVSLWLVAADRDGELSTDCPRKLAKLASVDGPIDVQLLEKQGWLTRDANVASAWRQDDANVSAKGRGEERREEEGSGCAAAAGDGPSPSPCVDVSKKQKAFAESLLEPHGMDLQTWMDRHRVQVLTPTHIDAIVAEYKGRAPDGKAAARFRNQLLRDLKAKMAEAYTGDMAAMTDWIEQQTDDPKIRFQLFAHLQELEAKSA